MSQNPKKEIPRSELLSAYLDDELTGPERGQVEKLLAEDQAARAELEGLRRVSLSLRHLERQSPPPTLELTNVRRLALLEQDRGLLDRLEDHLPGVGRQSSLLLLFALIVVFGLAIYSFAAWQWQDPQARLPVVLDPPPETTPDLSQDFHKGHTALVGGKIFVRDGEVWFEEGLGQQTKARSLALDSGEGRRLLAARPDLRGVVQLGEVVLEVNGEVLRLLPADRPVGGL